MLAIFTVREEYIGCNELDKVDDQRFHTIVIDPIDDISIYPTPMLRMIYWIPDSLDLLDSKNRTVPPINQTFQSNFAVHTKHQFLFLD